MSDILMTKNLCKVFRKKEHEVKALWKINLKIATGDYISIQGPSGSGKTTLLNMLGCLDVPSSGHVVIDGIDVSKMGEGALTKVRAKKVGFVFQSFNLIPILSAVENVELPLELTKMNKKERRERAEELLELVGLGDRLNHRPGELSAGEQQRVAIARALANKPAIILADEPTGNLDSKTGKKIMALLEELNQKTGTTIIVVTHDKSMAQFTKTMIFLKDGRVTLIKNDQAGFDISKALGLPRNVTNKLIRGGLDSLKKLLAATEKDLKKVPRLNRQNRKRVMEAIEEHQAK